MGVEPADAVAALDGKPDDAVIVYHQRVRIAAGRRFVFTNLAGGGIDPAYSAVAIAGVPHHAALIHEQAMRMRALR